MEHFKDIVGFEGLYQISNKGRIKSLKRANNKILKPKRNKGGYCQVSLYKDKKEYQPYVHRLVALSFIDNPKNLKTINHKDAIKTNNNAYNLEWMTLSDNLKDAWEKGIFYKSEGENNYRTKLSNVQVLEIRKTKGSVRYKKLCDKFGVKIGVIQDIMSNVTFRNI